MARPKKEKELTHTHHLHLRLTDVEYEVVSEAAKQAKLTLSEYTRRQLAGIKVTVKYEIVADVPELKKLIAEFGKIDGNLNQIARHLNQGGQQYLVFKHDEKTGKPALNKNGNLQFRDNYYLDSINCDAFTFDAECMEVNNIFVKTRITVIASRAIILSAKIPWTLWTGN